MRKVLWCLAIAASSLLLSRALAADEPKKFEKNGPPGPEMLFDRFDADHDGFVSEGELPANIPEPIKAALKVVDKNGDKKISKEEFAAAVKDLPLPPPMAGRHFGPPPFGPGTRECSEDKKFKLPDAKEIFAKLDRDKDGKLSFEEFNEGVKQVEKKMTEHRGGPQAMMPFAPGVPGPQFGQGPDGPRPQFGPGPGHPSFGHCPCGCPCQQFGPRQDGHGPHHFGPPQGGHGPEAGHGPDGPGMHQQQGRDDRGPQAGRGGPGMERHEGRGGRGPEAGRGPDGPGAKECPAMRGGDGKAPPHDGGKAVKDLEAKFKDLEAKLKVLEAKVGIK